MGGAESRAAFRDKDEIDEALRLATRFTRNEIRTPTPSTPSKLPNAVDWFKAGDVVRLKDIASLTYTVTGAARWRSERPTWNGSDDCLEWPCAPYGLAASGPAQVVSRNT